MSEQRSEYAGLCPPWCTSNGDPVEARHTHVSADLVVGAGATARLVRDDDAEPVRVLVGETAISVEEAQAFAHALLRLVADARLAEPGLGFVEHLVTQRGLSTSQLALAASLDVERVRAQRSGAAVLTVREFDQLALAAAQLHCGGDAPVEVTLEHEPVLVVEPA
ncbi:MAG: hypothetical protein HOQ22_16935, partial [Nocardioidaceae bacterium]|nr:hypothetical protein [Nocardioidaceae bacterium]